MAFKEDKVILEHIQLEEERDPNFKRVILEIDGAPMKIARIVDALIEPESAIDATASRHKMFGHRRERYSPGTQSSSIAVLDHVVAVLVVLQAADTMLPLGENN